KVAQLPSCATSSYTILSNVFHQQTYSYFSSSGCERSLNSFNPYFSSKYFSSFFDFLKNKYIVAIAPIIKITSIINAGIYSVLSSGKYKKSINIITVTSFFKYHINLFHVHCFKRHKLLYTHINCKYSISNLNYNYNNTQYDTQQCSFFTII